MKININLNYHKMNYLHATNATKIKNRSLKENLMILLFLKSLWLIEYNIFIVHLDCSLIIH